VVNSASDLRYTKAICATRINLGFLRRLNRDQQTDRSVEIPACGGFMLAERSDEHRRLFVEGIEAEFFSSPEELVEKTRFYLADETRRAAVAQAGRRRCLESDYTHLNRVRFMLADVLAGQS
jgi:spore maturation protein CgeB